MHYRARTYDPRVGRFVQKDPIVELRTTEHFIYASNSPGTLVDPKGTTTTVRNTGSSIEVTASIELQAEEGGRQSVTDKDMRSAARRWKRVIEKFWNPRPEFVTVTQGFPVKVRADISVRAAGAPRDRTRHRVMVPKGAPGPTGMVMAISELVDVPGIVTDGSVWPLLMSDRTTAHEFGHLLGLDDEYGGIQHLGQLPGNLNRNRQLLIPRVLDVQVVKSTGRFFGIQVSFARKGDSSGLMAAFSNEIKDYYLEWAITFNSRGTIPGKVRTLVEQKERVEPLINPPGALLPLPPASIPIRPF